MDIENLIDSFSEFKEVKNINRETMMNILEDVFKSVGISTPCDQSLSTNNLSLFSLNIFHQ